jgi:hypothetical protein
MTKYARLLARLPFIIVTWVDLPTDIITLLAQSFHAHGQTKMDALPDEVLIYMLSCK